MARQFHRKQRLPALTEINVTPLIDMAFALLIIFMITAPLLEQTIEIDLPVESLQPQPEQRMGFHTISIDRDGGYYWDDEPVTPELLGVLLDRAAQEPDPPVLNIRGDAGLRYQEIITVIDKARQRQLTRISLETRVE